MAITVIMQDSRPDGAGGTYKKGSTYSLPDTLATYFLDIGLAKRTSARSEQTGATVSGDSAGRFPSAPSMDKSVPLTATLSSGGIKNPRILAQLGERGRWINPRQIDRTIKALTVDAFSATTGWSAVATSGAGTLTVATGVGPSGEDVLEINCTAAGSRVYDKSIVLPSADFRSGFFAQWAWSDDWSKITTLNRFFFCGTPYYQQFVKPHLGDITQWTQGFDDRINGEWRLLIWHGAQMSASGGATGFDVDTGDTTLVRFGAAMLAGGKLRLGRLMYGVKSVKPKINFSFDDNNLSDYTVSYPILRQFGMVGTCNVISRLVGSNNFLNVAQLRELQDAGWTVGVHGEFSHVDTLQADYTAIYNDVKMNRDFLLTNGLGPADTYCYPEGDYTPASMLALRDLGFRVATTVASSQFPMMYGYNPLIRPRKGTSGQTLAQLQAAVDQTIARGGDLDLFSHMVTPGGAGIHTDWGIFYSIVEYVAAKAAAGQCDAGMNREDLPC